MQYILKISMNISSNYYYSFIYFTKNRTFIMSTWQNVRDEVWKSTTIFTYLAKFISKNVNGYQFKVRKKQKMFLKFI